MQQQEEVIVQAGNKEDKVEKPAKKTADSQDELKLGEYFLHIFIEDITSLDVDKEEAAEIMVRMTAFGDEKYSRTLKNITNDTSAYIGEHFFYVKIFDNRENLENQNIEVSVIKKRTMKSEVIGTIEINVSSIYFEDKHCM